MALKIWLLTGLLLSAGACSFDGSSESFDDELVGEADPEQDPEQDPVQDPNPDPTPDPNPNPDPNPDPTPDPSPTIYFAIGETTPDGVLSGSFELSKAIDDDVEVIRGEVDDDDELLRHEWQFATLVPGQYKLSLVAKGFSPTPGDSLVVEYKTASSDNTEVFTLLPDNVLRSYEATLTIADGAGVEVRVSLAEDADAVEAGNGSDTVNILRRVEVDYLALSEQL